jgi:hypothetical protein
MPRQLVRVTGPSAEQLGGDFAGGVTPTNLFSASTASNSVTPVLSNLLVSGAVSAGGTGANNQLPIIYTAVATYPGQTSLSIPSLASATSSATTTQISFSAAGFTVGDPCEVQYSFSTSTLITSANVTAVSGSSVTTTVSLLNVSGSSITATVLETAPRRSTMTWHYIAIGACLLVAISSSCLCLRMIDGGRNSNSIKSSSTKRAKKHSAGS